MTSTFFIIASAAFFYVKARLWRDLKGNPRYDLKNIG
tara:strand:+ start:574 stop:684 length:111 start_codon:yes stop_codon:yes gene_type:complete